jgi:hypothetical protein
MQSLSAIMRTGGALGIALVLGAACADDTSKSTGADAAADGITFEVVSGSNQSAPAGTELPQPLVVRARNSAGSAVANQIVNFRVVAGGGSVFAGTAKTDGSGYAREWWTLGPTAGLNRIEARAVNASTGERQVFGTFEATGLAERPAVASVTVAPGTQRTAASIAARTRASTAASSSTDTPSRSVSTRMYRSIGSFSAAHRSISPGGT